MAHPVYLVLRAAGTEIPGESTGTVPGPENAIECIYFEQAATTSREYGAGMATGRREYRPLVIRKRIDRASPLLWKALTEGQPIEGSFMFFRSSSEGVTEHFYTIEIKQARISSIREYVPDILDPATKHEPPLEEINFVFHTSSWTYREGNITYQDTWIASP